MLTFVLAHKLVFNDKFDLSLKKLIVILKLYDCFIIYSKGLQFSFYISPADLLVLAAYAYQFFKNL